MKKLGLALAALALCAGGSPAFAFAGIQDRYVFYDMAEGQVVGYLIYWCDGRVEQTGSLTPFYSEEHYDC